jgi:hypothetical protein
MRIMILFVSLGFMWSCASKSKPGEEPVAIKTYDTSTLYYDIPLAIHNEIAEIKRTFAFTWRIDIENGKRDSAAIDTTQLLQLAAPFLEYNLNERSYRKYYKEDLFEDGDTRSIVLTYSTNHPDFPLRTASVLLDNESQDLKRIDITRSYAAKDTSREERLAWIAGKGFQVIKMVTAGGKESITQTQVSWKNR